MSPKPVDGDRVIKIYPFLWVDQNGDSQIDDKEMLEASKVAEEMKNVHLDWNLLQGTASRTETGFKSRRFSMEFSSRNLRAVTICPGCRF